MKREQNKLTSVAKTKRTRRESKEIREELGVPTLIRIVRLKCLECVCGSTKDVRLCTCSSCYLWPYRLGRMPLRKDFQVPDRDQNGHVVGYRPYAGFKKETRKW